MSKREPVPPKATPIIFYQLSGQLLLGTITHIDSNKLQLSNMSIVQVVGLRTPHLEPIYGIKSPILGSMEIYLENITHWEIAPEDLRAKAHNKILR